MAYLEDQTLSCPGCGATAPVTWVVGVGPHTRPGEGPAYVSATPSDAWRVEPAGRDVEIYCVACDTLAATKRRTDR